uniref:Sec1 family domain-containing protein 1 n=1 Tax=Macrostomum lignano TaxID=282301 RepID=A0A1I8H378_9PLAT
VLIYDRSGQDMISPLLTVKDLRDLGVTLHLPLHSDREPLSDVAAVYFMNPSEENLQRLGRDLAAGLYESYHLNFISPISRSKLEDLAQAAIGGNAVGQISRVVDQYTDFICLEEDLFVLRHHSADSLSYKALNRPDSSDEAMEAMLNEIAGGLFSVCVTLGAVPVIRCPAGNAAEAVAAKLDKKLRDNLRDARNSLFTGGGDSAAQYSFQRPLLLLLDRSLDLATMLHHPWTYQALVHDVLGSRLNRVELPQSGPPSHQQQQQKRTTAYDLLAEEDNFWSAQRGAPFPEVADAVKRNLEKYKQEEEKVGRLKRSMGFDAELDDKTVTDTMSVLNSAMSDLPALLAMKRSLDMHTNVATCLAEKIKARQLDLLFELEEKLLAKQSLDRPLVDVLADPEAGSFEDKLRLLLVAVLSDCPQASGAELDELLSQLNRLASEPSAALSSESGGLHNLPAARIADCLMENRAGQAEVEEYRYFDPKLHRVTDPSQIPRQKQPFQEAIVFVVGGGNYIEYQNLVDLRRTSKSSGVTGAGGGGGGSGGGGRRITYGSTQLVTGCQFPATAG